MIINIETARHIESTTRFPRNAMTRQTPVSNTLIWGTPIEDFMPKNFVLSERLQKYLVYRQDTWRDMDIGEGA